MAYDLHYMPVRCRECGKPSCVIVERDMPLCGECFGKNAVERWRARVAKIVAMRAERRRAAAAGAR